MPRSVVFVVPCGHDTADEQEYHVSDAATRPVWVPGPLYPIRFLAGWRKKRPEPGLVWFR